MTIDSTTGDKRPDPARQLLHILRQETLAQLGEDATEQNGLLGLLSADTAQPLIVGALVPYLLNESADADNDQAIRVTISVIALAIKHLPITAAAISVWRDQRLTTISASTDGKRYGHKMQHTLKDGRLEPTELGFWQPEPSEAAFWPNNPVELNDEQQEVAAQMAEVFAEALADANTMSEEDSDPDGSIVEARSKPTLH